MLVCILMRQKKSMDLADWGSAEDLGGDGEEKL